MKKTRKVFSVLCALALLLSSLSVSAVAQAPATSTDLEPAAPVDELPMEPEAQELPGQPEEPAGEMDVPEEAPADTQIPADAEILIPHELTENTWTVSGALTAEGKDFLIRLTLEKGRILFFMLESNRPVKPTLLPESKQEEIVLEQDPSEEGQPFSYLLEGYALKEGDTLLSIEGDEVTDFTLTVMTASAWNKLQEENKAKTTVLTQTSQVPADDQSNTLTNENSTSAGANNTTLRRSLGNAASASGTNNENNYPDVYIHSLGRDSISMQEFLGDLYSENASYAIDAGDSSLSYDSSTGIISGMERLQFNSAVKVSVTDQGAGTQLYPNFWVYKDQVCHVDSGVSVAYKDLLTRVGIASPDNYFLFPARSGIDSDKGVTCDYASKTLTVSSDPLPDEGVALVLRATGGTPVNSWIVIKNTPPTPDDGVFTYELDEASGTARITGLVAGVDAKDLVIENTVELDGKTYTVTSIASKAFKGNSRIQTVTVNAHNLNIGANAFEGCSSLNRFSASYTGSDGCLTVGAFAFADCKRLKYFISRTGIDSIGQKAFYNASSLVTLIAGESQKTNLCVNAFQNNTGELYFDGGLGSIASYTFYGTNAVKVVTPNPKSYSYYSLMTGRGSEVVVLTDGTSQGADEGEEPDPGEPFEHEIFTVEKDGEDGVIITGLRDDYSGNGNVSVPGTLKINNRNYTLTGIEAGAFKGENRIVSLTLENSIPSSVVIEGDTFANMENLKRLECHMTSVTVEEDAFADNSVLETVIFTGSGSQILKQDAFCGSQNIKTLRIDNTYNIESGAMEVTNGELFICDKDSAYTGLAAKVGTFKTYAFSTAPYWFSGKSFQNEPASAIYLRNLYLPYVDYLITALTKANSALKDIYLDYAREDLADAERLEAACPKVKFHYRENTSYAGGLYVSGDGNDETGDGTKENPYGSFAKIAEVVAASGGKTVETRTPDTALTDILTPAFENTGVTQAPGTFTNIVIKETSIAYVLKTLPVSGEETWDGGTSNIALYRDPEFTGALVNIPSGSTLTLKNAVLDGNKDGMTRTASSPIIYIDRGTLILDQGAVLRNNENSSNGGAVFSYYGTINILDGSLMTGNQALSGGGIYARESSIDMSGGTIKGNSANKDTSYGSTYWYHSAGGGILLNHSSTMVLSGGLIQNNSTNGCGGGIALGLISGNVGKQTLTMTGGTIDGNTSGYMGGGILIQTPNEADITGGYITNNHAGGTIDYCYDGGGIYVNGSNNSQGILRLKNVIITENEASNGYGGGGLCGCGTSKVRIYLTDGGAFFGNTYMKRSPDDVVLSSPSGYPDFRISPIMLGGGAYRWQSYDSDVFDPIVVLSRKEYPINALTRRDFIDVWSKSSTEDQAKAKSLGKVFITGNSAQFCGGGIATNGTVIIGTEPTSYAELKITKTWTDDFVENRPTDYIDFLVMGKPEGSSDDNKVCYGVARMVAEKQSDGTYTWPTLTINNLPESINGQKMEYSVVEDEDELNSRLAKKEGSPVYAAYYETTTDGNGVPEITVTNREVTSVMVQKFWDDGQDQDGLRPAALTVSLLADGEKIQTVELNKKNNWIQKIEKLPKYKDEKEITYSWEEKEVPKGYQLTSSVNGNVTTLTNTHVPETISVTVLKVWSDNDNQVTLRPASLKVNLLADGRLLRSFELNQENKWTVTVNDLPKCSNGKEIRYTWTEKDIPAGYVLTSSVNGTVTTLTNTLNLTGSTELSGTKLIENRAFMDGDQWTFTVTAPAGVPMPEQTQVTITPKEGTSAAFSFGKIAFGNADAGKTYVYTVTETGNVPDVTNDSAKTVTVEVGLNTDGTLKITNSTATAPLTFVNTYEEPTPTPEETPEPTPTPEESPEPTPTPEETPEPTPAPTPTPTPTQLTVVETPTPTPTPTPEPETTEVHGQKTWLDNGNHDGLRPDTITINLHANGQIIARARVRAGRNWTWNFTGLKKYDNDGKEIVYTVSENPVDGYTTIINGFNVINVRNPAPGRVQVVKVWEDMENLDGSRPASIKVTLTANGEAVSVYTLSEENDWSAAVDNLPMADDNGDPITYAWTEGAVAGYSSTTSVVGSLTLLTNRHEPELTEVSVRKVWNDNNNQLRMRPAALIVTLSNGTSVKLTEANHWSATITGLPKTYKGQPVVYTWSEQEPAGYVQESVSEADGVTTFTNRIWERPEPPEDEPAAHRPGKPTMVISDYDTPLGVDMTVNHVGHCFD